jgi:lantibiotic transport system permease protein
MDEALSRLVWRSLTAEWMKLRGSMALPLCLATPSAVVALNAVIALGRGEQVTFSSYANANAALWAFAMLPLATMALALVLAQLEHSCGAWDHLLVMPGARPLLFLSKFATAILLLAAMHLLLWSEIVVSWHLFAIAAPQVAAGAGGVAPLSWTLGRMALAAFFMLAIQLASSLYFRSFVPSLLLGISGTIVAVGAVLARSGIYFPWLAAVNVMSTPERSDFVVVFGVAGGLATTLMAVLLLGCVER